VPFGGPDDYILYLDPFNFRKTAISGTDFDCTSFFATENRFNMRMLKYKLPLIIIVAA